MPWSVIGMDTLLKWIPNTVFRIRKTLFNLKNLKLSGAKLFIKIFDRVKF